MVNFVLHPLTQIFMQEYREEVKNECYNVQSPPLRGYRRCEQIFTVFFSFNMKPAPKHSTAAPKPPGAPNPHSASADSGGKPQRSRASSQAPAKACHHRMNAPDYDSEDDVCNGVQHVFNQKRETCKRKIYDKLKQVAQDIQDLDRRNASAKRGKQGTMFSKLE